MERVEPAGLLKSNDRPILAVAWIVTLLASALPDIIWSEVAGPSPLWLYGVKAAGLVSLAALTWLLISLRPLRLYFLLLLVVEIGLWFENWLMATPGWEAWEAKIPWVPGMLVIQLFEVGIVLLVAVLLLVFRKRRQEVYAVVGDMRAAAQPVRWLGQRKPTVWPSFGPVLGVCLFFGGILFLWLLTPPSGSTLLKLLPMLPGVILIAAINSFDEEAIYRCGLMNSLELPIGKMGALLVSSIFFGLAHYSGGFPGGLPWFVISSFIGYMLGKSMQETKGFLWAFLIHLVADIPVLAFSAMATLSTRGF